MATKITWNMDEFTRIRKAPALVAKLHAMGEEWTGDLNEELHAAQARRKQPVEDGYTYHINTGGTRARMYIVAATARAQAHERKHSSILKAMRTSGLDTKVHTAAQQAVRAKRAAARARKRARQQS